MIADRIIEQGTLTTHEGQAAVEVRIPWYRALPGSCIAGATLSIDGTQAPADTLRWSMNGRTFSFDELVNETDEWWFPLDSATLTGQLALRQDIEEHEVQVELKVYIPYIITDHGVLHIEESDTKTMKAEQR
ncbi:C-glycoside deglycosidase beta subunit domain-containing protein [Glutamicibacter halophytocola]|uniref:C-glycoside deglycosidase beta subunit domain-containing protein n=1 Tax=Glutamicibacter halophytocola TaxID=1933880 RepID=UPI0015C57571|nr:DUF6379 domain-containing protein [Glutamicibacter halophytocola]NQD40890.1 flagellar biosynthesis protein [Glutamicibacter halophytocola]